MVRLHNRLHRLEAQHRAAEPELHALCKLLFQARVIGSSPSETWEPGAVLPEQRPDDPALYPQLECFYGDPEECPHRAWADDSYTRDKHFHSLQAFTDEDLGEVGPEPTPEELQRQREGVERYRAWATADLPRLERKLARARGTHP